MAAFSSQEALVFVLNFYSRFRSWVGLASRLEVKQIPLTVEGQGAVYVKALQIQLNLL